MADFIQKQRYTITKNLALQHPYLATTGSILLAKDNHLELVIHSKDTSTRNSTKDVGASTLEEGLGTLLRQDLLESIQGALVLDGLSRGHHHPSADSVNGVRCKTRTVGDQPTKSKAGKEVVLQTGER